MRSERWTENPEDEGSTPSWPTNIKDSNSKILFAGSNPVFFQKRIGAMVDAID